HARARDGTVLDQQIPRARAHDLADGPVCLRRCRLWRLRALHARAARPQTRLGVDEELAGDDDLVAFGESLADFALAARLEAELDFPRPEFAFALGHDDDAALTGAYDRLGRYEQRLRSRPLREDQRREHAGLQPSAWIGELDPRAQRARRRIHLRQDRAHPPAEYLAGEARHARLDPRSRTQPRALRLGHF